jgi:hypothetical protein
MAGAALMSRDPKSYEEVKALGATARRQMATLIALSESVDPYVAGSPGRMEWALWFADLWKELNIQPGAHMRRIHYLLVSQESPILMPDGTPYENTVNCGKALNRAGRDARYLELIPANAIVDRRNPKPIINLEEEQDSPAEIGAIAGSIEKHHFGQSYRAPRLNLPMLVLSEPIVAQRYHLEVWIEKSTANEVLLPLGRRSALDAWMSAHIFFRTRRCRALTRQRTSRDDWNRKGKLRWEWMSSERTLPASKENTSGTMFGGGDLWPSIASR